MSSVICWRPLWLGIVNLFQTVESLGNTNDMQADILAIIDLVDDAYRKEDPNHSSQLNIGGLL
jgi:hypothetical protein